MCTSSVGAPAALWQAHDAHRAEMFELLRARGVDGFDPARLTIGFARRAAGYKRADLLLRDPARLERLLARHPVQFVFAGKAHPEDGAGKSLVARVAQAAKGHPGRITFLENYDMALGRVLTRGCDVWLNTPRRPLEASGTSGMKAALNGVLNLSILDGWWAEGCEHGVNGWAIGDEGPSDDERDLDALFRVFEEEVAATWADRELWTSMMLASITTAAARFTAERMVDEYFERLYAPSREGRT